MVSLLQLTIHRGTIELPRERPSILRRARVSAQTQGPRDGSEPPLTELWEFDPRLCELLGEWVEPWQHVWGFVQRR